MKLLYLMLVLVMVSACSTADVTGDINKRAYGDTVFKNDGNGTQTITVNVYGSSTQETATKITTDNDPANRTDPALALSSAGGLATLAKDGAEALLDDVSSKLDARVTDSRVDNSIESTVPAVVPVIKTDDVKVDPETNSTEYNSSEVHSLKLDHDKMFTWLDLTGDDYGKNVKFVWEGCNALVVPDAAITTTRDGTSNQAQAYYFCGTDPEHQHGMSGRASIYADPSCNAETVTLFFNEVK